MIQHGKRIITETYYEGAVASAKEEHLIDVFTDYGHIMHEVIAAMAVITKGEATKLEIEISVDSKGRYRLKKKWAVA